MNKKVKIASLALALSLAFTACSNDKNKEETPASTNEASTAVSTEETNKATEDMSVESTEEAMAPAATEVELGDVVLHRGYQAPHGDKSVARIVVLTSGDKIINANIDEYQYFDKDSDFVALPNEDGAFGEGAAEGKILGSKVENNDAYSAMMEEKAEATMKIADNYQAIVDFAKGKTISELEDAIAGMDGEDNKDAVTGATLVDAPNYLKAIVEVAKDNTLATNVVAENPEEITLKQTYGAPHGDKSFGDAVVALEGDKIVGVSMDELQYFGENGLPNSDKGFGEGYADPKAQLSSKLLGSDDYSALMKDKANATKSIMDNYRAITDFVTGKTIEEVQTVVDENEAGKPVDAISEATLVDTVGYLQMILDAANK
jgi:hypothetical protein